MVRWRGCLLFLLCLAVALLNAREAPANGFRLFTHGAAAAGQGNAFVAEASDPTTLYYNPAGITQIPRLEFAGALALKGGNTSYTSLSGATASGPLGTPFIVPPPSNLYATLRLKDFGATGWKEGLALGLAVNNPFGVSQHWSSSSPLAALATAATLPLIDIKPTVAYRFNEYAPGRFLRASDLPDACGQRNHPEWKPFGARRAIGHALCTAQQRGIRWGEN